MSVIRSLWKKATLIWDPVQLQLWLQEARQQGGFGAFARTQLAIFFLTARRLRDEDISRRAAALTYFSLLSLVPLIAVAFALFKAFGGLRRVEDRLRGLILENLAVGRQEEVGAWIEQFVENINAGAIAGVGVLILFYSAVGLLTNVEKSFNQIWGVQRMRPLASRFVIYWGMITLAPPLLGVSLSLSAQLLDSDFASALMTWLPFGLGRVIVSSLGTLAVCLAFVLMYVIIPNTRVPLRSAALGGLTAGILWSASKALFITLTASSAKYNAIYGALSALPLLILWLYTSWLIVLFGATFTVANQTVTSNTFTSSDLTLSIRFREQLATRLLLETATDFSQGKLPPSAETLAARTGVLLPVVQRMLDVLVEHHLLDDVQDKGYVPARTLAALTLADVSETLRYRVGTELPFTPSAHGTTADTLLADADRLAFAALKRKTVEHLVSRQAPGKE